MIGLNLIKYFLVLYALLYSKISWSGSIFQLINRQYGDFLASQADIDHVYNNLEIEVNKSLPDVDAGQYLTAISNSMSGTTRGMGVGYTQYPLSRQLALQMSIAGDIGDNSFYDLYREKANTHQIKGMAANITAYFGLRWYNTSVFNSTIYLSYMDINYPKWSRGVRGRTQHYSSHIQFTYNPNFKKRPERFSWKGITFTSGIIYATMDLAIHKGISKSFSHDIDLTPVLNDPDINIPQEVQDLPTPIVTATAYLNGEANIKMYSNAFTIPIEVSTQVELFKYYNFFGGLGFHFSLAKSKGSAEITSPVVVSDNYQLFSQLIATTKLDIGQQAGKSKKWDHRRFFGLEYAQLPVAVNIQIYFASNNTEGVSLSAKFFW